MKRLLDTEYRRYSRVAKIMDNAVMPYVEFRQQYLLEHVLPKERIEAYQEKAKAYHEAQAERTFLRKEQGLPPLRHSKMDKMLIQRTKEHDDAD